MFWFGREKDKMQKTQQNNMYNTEAMLPVSEIRSDTVILKDGGLRAVIKVDGLNIDLKNYDEQEIVVQQYKKFLNGLWFPIQILARNTYLELSDYISYMRENVSHMEQEALRDQGEWYINFLDEINTQQGLIYVKEFYIIIPYYSLDGDVQGMRKPRWQQFMNALSTTETAEKVVDRYRSFVSNEKFLSTRVNVIIEWLKGMGVSWNRLWLRDLISLLFKYYNPDLHKDQSVYID